MNHQKSPAIFSLAIICTFQLFFINVAAQVQTPRYISTTALSNAFYEYLPQGYSQGTAAYPLLIFAHGSGEIGDGSPSQLTRVLRNGPPKQINQGIFPTYFLVNGDTFRYLVISPQFTASPTPDDLNNVINYAVANYRVDINRIYLTGLSMGGGNVWNYVSNNSNYANRIAAIVPICGFSYPIPANCQVIAAANVAVWATHNDGDPTVPVAYTINYVDYTNAAPTPPTPLAKKTIFISNSHDAWTRTYDFNFKEDGVNVYEWMLKFRRYLVTLSVNGLDFQASKKDNDKVLLQWKTSRENNSRGFEIQRSNDGTNFIRLSFMNSNNSGQGATYSFTDQPTLGGKNYYRLKQIEPDGKFLYSNIRFVDMNRVSIITIYPNPTTEILNINNDHAFVHARLNIRNINGQLVKQSGLNGAGTFSIDLKNLAAAVYTAEIMENSNIIKMIFIKE